MLDEQTKAAVRVAVAATLRQIAGWGLRWEDGQPADTELCSVASQVAGMEPDEWCCPMCQEDGCEDGCALFPVMAQSADDGC